MNLLQPVEDALWAAAAERLPAQALERRALVAAIEARSRRYTSERERLHQPLAGLDRQRDLAARALFFGLADTSKVLLPLGELLNRAALPARWRVLDAGAGALAMTLGLRVGFPSEPLEVLACDSDGDALALGAAAAARLGLTVRTAVMDVTRELPSGPFDLVLAGTVLNELGDPLALARRLLGLLADDGALIIIEPALRDTSRALHQVRDALLAEGAHVVAPCTRTHAPCPALADPRDWCHEDRPWSPPERLSQLAAATGLRDGGLKFSYLVLRRQPPRPFRTVALRVVSDDVSGKGQVARILCGDGTTRETTILRKRDPERSRLVLRRSRRGDTLFVDPGDGHLDDEEP